ncbi:MAG: hypothetical protein K6T35_06940 [Meiothermus silvanus]|nr:hypothetical protein [Allomeiothermus silvanus]
MEAGIIKKLGAFFSYGDLRLGQGRENAKDFLRQNPELANELEEKLRSNAGATSAARPVAVPAGVDEDDEGEFEEP